MNGAAGSDELRLIRAAVLCQVTLVAPLEVNELLTGPTGTGKSQLIHAVEALVTRAAGNGAPQVER